MAASKGQVFYLMGASGAGKDSLLQGCRARAKASPVPLLVAHRYITREPDGLGENHVWLPPAEFEQRASLGAFAMHWRANGHRYGIGREIDHWLEQGSRVLVNGSRAYLDQARARYGQALVPVLVKVDADRLRQRLVQRRRESHEEIDARIMRAQELEKQVPDDSVVIDNNGAVEDAVTRLMDAIRGVG